MSLIFAFLEFVLFSFLGGYVTYRFLKEKRKDLKYASFWLLSCAFGFSFAFFIPAFTIIFGPKDIFATLFKFLDVGLMLCCTFWFFLLGTFFISLVKWRKFVILHLIITLCVIFLRDYKIILYGGTYAFIRDPLVSIFIPLFWFPYYTLGAVKFIHYLHWIGDKSVRRRIKLFIALCYSAILAYFFIILMTVFRDLSLIFGLIAQILTIFCAVFILCGLFCGRRQA